MRLPEEQDHHFDFSMDKHAFIATTLLKLDTNLNRTRDKLVPDEVSEVNFWRNYFYQVELSRSQMGLESRLGDRKDEQERAEALQKAVSEMQKAIS